MDREEEMLWLVLQQLCHQRGAQLRKLLTVAPDPLAILQAPDSQWESSGVAQDIRVSLRRWRQKGIQAGLRREAVGQQALLRECCAQILVLGSASYPALLGEIHDPPPLLFLRGSLPVLQLPQLAIVGSRKTSAAGRRAAAEFASAATAAGLSVASGLALGIDGVAHRAALAAEGPTVAVMATGIDITYPHRHQQLAESISQQGALMTEFPPGTGPRREQFPQRNRLISGLSMGVLVVEAALPSGSLITARTALEQGREVFALPHSIYHPQGRGCNELLAQGAKLVQTAEDIFEELGPLRALCEETGPDAAQGEIPTPELTPALDRVFNALGYEPLPLAVLAEQLALDIAALMQQLTELELRGMVERRGGCYMRC